MRKELEKHCGEPIGMKVFSRINFYTFEEGTLKKLWKALNTMGGKGISSRDKRRLIRRLYTLNLYKIKLNNEFRKWVLAGGFNALIKTKRDTIFNSTKFQSLQGTQKVREFINDIEALKGHLPKRILEYIRKHKSYFGTPSTLMEDIDAGDIAKANLRRFLKEKLKPDKDHTQISKSEIAYFDSKTKNTPDFLRDLMKLSDPDQTHYNKEQLSYGGECASHPALLKNSLEIIKGAIAIELPIWFKNKRGKIIGGKIDLAVARDGALYILDFKPHDDIAADSKELSSHFWKYIPQITAYALAIQKLLGIDTQEMPIYCVLFNQKGGWMFRPELLAEFDKFIDSQGLAAYALWREFFLSY
jgi:ATP-dependent exoDNAse (exonuclease V) beta subunit